jgi:hypothetical protein
MDPRAIPSRLVAGLLLGVAAVGAALPVAAQRSNSGVGIGPSEELSHPPSDQSSSAAPRVEHLLGGQDGGGQDGKDRARRSGERSRDRREGDPSPR